MRYYGCLLLFIILCIIGCATASNQIELEKVKFDEPKLPTQAKIIQADVDKYYLGDDGKPPMTRAEVQEQRDQIERLEVAFNITKSLLDKRDEQLQENDWAFWLWIACGVFAAAGVGLAIVNLYVVKNPFSLLGKTSGGLVTLGIVCGTMAHYIQWLHYVWLISAVIIVGAVVLGIALHQGGRALQVLRDLIASGKTSIEHIEKSKIVAAIDAKLPA